MSTDLDLEDGEFRILRLPRYAPMADEQMGTKRKFWVEHEDYGRSLFKEGRERHHENWAEKAAFHLALKLGLPVARIELAIWDSPDGPRMGTISPSFIDRREELRHGNELLEQHVAGYPRDENRPSSHTVSTVLEVLTRYRPSLEYADHFSHAAEQFLGYLLLDAWIGNMDRHHENWALIRPPSAPAEHLILAPTYDHGSSLGRELTSRRQKDLLEATVRIREGVAMNRSIAQYAEGPKAAGRFYRRRGDDRPLSPVAAYFEASARLPDAARYWIRRLEQVDPSRVAAIFDAFPKGWATKYGREFALELLAHNRNRILSESGN